MPRKRSLPPGPPEGFPRGAPRDAIAVELGRRISKAMVDRNMNQSDLAREAAKHMPNKKFGRYSTSLYIRGKQIPGPERLRALSRALNIKEVELLPNRGVSPAESRTPPLDMRLLEDGNVWLRVNQSVPQDVAMKVLALLGSTYGTDKS
jgi:transcriptional regulator with XRE-family HTH domain